MFFIKNNMQKEKISLLIYSNETFLPIANLAIDEFNKFSNELNIKKYLASNKFINDDDLEYNDFIKIDANIPLENDGRHFAKILIKSLEVMDSEYVLFMPDDMFVINQIKKENLDKIINLMDGENIDHISLMSYGHNWEIMNIDYSKYGLPNNYIFNMNMSYIFMITLQPMIWKVSSFLEFLKHNENISIREFDTSSVKNKKGQTRLGPNSDGYYETPDDFWDYGFKHCCFKRYYENTPYPFDDRPFDGDYFLFLWSEVIAGGKFNLNRGNNCRTYLMDFLEKNNIGKTHKIYGKFLS